MSEALTPIIENDTIFDSLKTLPVEELVIQGETEAEVFESCGYKLVEDDAQKQAFLESMKCQVSLYQDQDFPKQTRSSSVRSNIEEGTTQVLTKEGMSYIAYSFDDNVTVVFESEEVDFFGEDKTVVKGFKVENIFLKGNDENTVDLMSLRRGRKVPIMFSFMGIKNTYSIEDDYVAICMPTRKLRTELLPDEWSIPVAWDTTSFKHLFLHENGHVSLHEYEVKHDIRVPETERNSNALLLHTVRELAKKYPRSGFYNQDEAKEWVENQLIKGYEPNYPLSRNLHDVELDPLQSTFDAAASQRRRGQVRDSLIEKKNENLDES